MDNIWSYEGYIKSIISLTENLGVVGQLIQIIGFVVFTLIIYILSQQKSSNNYIKDYQKKLEDIREIEQILRDLQEAIEQIDNKLFRLDQMIRNKFETLDITFKDYLGDIVSKETKYKEKIDILDANIRSNIQDIKDTNEMLKKERQGNEQNIKDINDDMMRDYVQLIFDFQELVSEVKDNPEMCQLFEDRIDNMRKRIKKQIQNYGAEKFNKFLTEHYSQETISMLDKQIDFIEVDKDGRINIKDDGRS